MSFACAMMRSNTDALNIIALIGLLLGMVAYFAEAIYWSVQKKPCPTSFTNPPVTKIGNRRSIISKMDDSGKNCIIFYGSQTGTAKDYAARLAKEGSSRFGLRTMTADLGQYDFEDLDQFSGDKIAMFIMATYGEGEPTDNAVKFHEFISSDRLSFSTTGGDKKALDGMKYVAFGLGNKTYEHYNSVIRTLVTSLHRLGAKRIGEVGEGDDGAGTMEEDFLAWKELMWAALTNVMRLNQHKVVCKPVFEVTEKPGLDTRDDIVYLGEPNGNHLGGTFQGPYDAHNPYIAPIVESKELFNDPDRNCLHMEIDVSSSDLSYTTGDHIAIWPTNASKEVDRFLNVLNLQHKRHTVISVEALDATAKVPFPSPTTYDAAVRFYMEICAPLSRQFIGTLAQFSPNEKIKAQMRKLGGDREYFASQVASKRYNIAQFLEQYSGGSSWDKIPFSIFVEGIRKIKPRYYSISSSSLVQPKRISITAAVDSVEVSNACHLVKGVTTNYLLALKNEQCSMAHHSLQRLDYDITGPRNKYDGIRVPVHVRHSTFRLPSDPSKPIIMVGPGTGVAPFRAFVQERAQMALNGMKLGKTILFLGCRSRSEDFVYETDWEEHKSLLGDLFEVITAFSRAGPQKVYVQHRLRERATEINELLLQGASFYVCGNAANMGRDVNKVLRDIIAEQRGIDKKGSGEIIENMRRTNRYQEDVW